MLAVDTNTSDTIVWLSVYMWSSRFAVVLVILVALRTNCWKPKRDVVMSHVGWGLHKSISKSQINRILYLWSSALSIISTKSSNQVVGEAGFRKIYPTSKDGDFKSFISTQTHSTPSDSRSVRRRVFVAMDWWTYSATPVCRVWKLSRLNTQYSPDVILCGWLGLKHQLTN